MQKNLGKIVGLGVTEEGTSKAIVVQVYYRVVFDQWSSLLLVVVLNKMWRDFSAWLLKHKLNFLPSNKEKNNDFYADLLRVEIQKKKSNQL